MKKTIIILTVVILLASQARAELIAEYTFSGDCRDTSGNDNHAMVYGAELTADRFGNAESAYTFDGNDYIQTPVNGNRVPLSYSVWFNSLQAKGERSIVDNDVSGRWGHSLIIGYWDGDGELDVQYHNGHINSGYSIQSNQWYHAAVVYSDTIKLWLNGQLIAEQTYTPPALDGTNFRLGRHNAGDPQWFIGTIDDVRFYDHALSVSEIQDLYHAVPEPTTMSLLGLGGLMFFGRRK